MSGLRWPSFRTLLAVRLFNVLLGKNYQSEAVRERYLNVWPKFKSHQLRNDIFNMLL